MKKNLLIGLCIVLLTIFVTASVPSVPTIILPANESVYFRDNVVLSCSGSEGADPIYYEYFGDGTSINVTTGTTFNWTSIGMGRPHTFYCRACNDTGISTTVVDQTGSGHNGENNGAVTTTGVLGDGFSFNSGESDFVNTTWYNTSRAISFWINTTSANTGIMGQRYDVIEEDGDWDFSVSSGNAQLIFYEGSGGDYDAVITGGAINDGSWHFITLVANNSNTELEIWIDGSLSASGAGGSPNPYDGGMFGTNQDGNQSFQLGRKGEGGWTYFNGMLDEVGIWNATLNESFIDTLYNSGNGYDPIAGGTFGNLEAYYNFNSTTACSANTGTYNLNIMDFKNCSSGNMSLNITFKNDTADTEDIIASISSLDFTFDSADDYNFSYVNATESGSFGFCSDADTISNQATGTIKYKFDDYPERTFSFDESLIGNTTLVKTLYLLPLSDGIFVSFQVVDAGNSPISGVKVIAERLVASTFVEVESGTTDDAGIVTFWLNPDVSHKFTFSKSGLDTVTQTLTPTQSSYTVTMGDGTSINETSYNYGVKYNIKPVNAILSNDTFYDFIFNITSETSNLTSYGFNIYNSTGGVLSSLSGSTPSGGFVNATINTTNHTTITMDYFWEINSSIQNGTKTWQVRSTYQGDFSLMNFFDDLKVFSNSGMDDFTRMIISFAIIFLVVAAVSFGLGNISAPAALILITILSAILEFVGLAPSLGDFPYFIPIMLMLFTIAYIIIDTSR